MEKKQKYVQIYMKKCIYAYIYILYDFHNHASKYIKYNYCTVLI